jgi:hypothetical protein
MRYGNKVRPGTQVSDWPSKSPVRAWVPKPVSSYTAFVTVTADVTAHVKGAWTEIIASSSADADCVDLAIQAIGASSVDTGTLVDVGIGGSGSEVAIISNIAVGSFATVANAPFANKIRIPVFVPAGSRISVRIQSVVTLGKTGQFAIRLMSGGNPSATSSTSEALGTFPASSEGTALNSTGWTEIVAATSKHYQYLLLIPSASNSVLASLTRTIVFGSGASGSEVSLTSQVFASTNQELVGLVDVDGVQGNFPAGIRLASNFATTNNNFDACIIATEQLGIPA